MYPAETTLYRAIVIAALIIGSIIVYFILSVIAAQRRFRRLQNTNLEAVISSIENERERISLDLHDELGPMLAGIKLRLSAIDVLTEKDEANMARSLEQMDEIIRKIRAIAYNFSPSLLKRKGLLIAVEEFIEQHTSTGGLEVSLTADQDLQVPDQAQIHVYRMLLEIIFNTVKHARATILQIELREVKGSIVIRSFDNGAGFDYKAAIRKAPGRGLQNLQMRADLLGGELFVESGVGNGTRYHIQFPIK